MTLVNGYFLVCQTVNHFNCLHWWTWSNCIFLFINHIIYVWQFFDLFNWLPQMQINFFFHFKRIFRLSFEKKKLFGRLLDAIAFSEDQSIKMYVVHMTFKSNMQFFLFGFWLTFSSFSWTISCWNVNGDINTTYT